MPTLVTLNMKDYRINNNGRNYNVNELSFESAIKENYFQENNYKIYSKSFTTYEEDTFVMFKKDHQRYLYVKGAGSLFSNLKGEIIAEDIKIVPCDYQNRIILNDYLPYTKPQAFGNKVTTMGVGDRLGLASPGHIEIMRQYDVKPILAQQSIRELDLTERNINDVLDSAAYAVIQEGYTGGFGADGDHLKLEEDIQLAINSGMSMLTLDCSDYIRNEVTAFSKEELAEAYLELDEEVRTNYEKIYLDQTFQLDGYEISFTEEVLMYNVLLYHDALNYMLYIYKKYVEKADHAIDFEVSIDETITITQPESHFLVANEITRQNVKVNSLAPRFIGEFQKGVDYMGDLSEFEEDFIVHSLIADYFDYKISIHSGSDKFSVFPIIAKHTKGLYHLKTAGTNWLEAIRVLSKYDTDLFREMHAYAIEYFPVAQAYYHITPDIEGIIPIDELTDEELPIYLEDRNARQVWHVTYGVLLTALDEMGNRLFKERFFKTMHNLEEEYKHSLVTHIGKHLELLEIPKLK